MTKQNFISMSLESGLKYDIKSDLYQYPTLVGIRKDYLEFNYHGVYLSFQKDFVGQPILRPLSCLTKEIDGATAFFRYYENDSPIKKQLVNLAYGIGDVDDFPFHVVLRMIKEHFDISDLISKNQAIDINTLETNPYK